MIKTTQKTNASRVRIMMRIVDEGNKIIAKPVCLFHSLIMALTEYQMNLQRAKGITQIGINNLERNRRKQNIHLERGSRLPSMLVENLQKCFTVHKLSTSINITHDIGTAPKKLKPSFMSKLQIWHHFLLQFGQKFCFPFC